MRATAISEIGKGDTNKPAASNFNKKDKRSYSNRDPSIQTQNDLAAFLGNSSINTLTYMSRPLATIFSYEN
jgi:hypothetical protein